MQAVDATVEELSTRVPRLKNVRARSDAMIGVYDGDGARFQRHIDNTARDGRRLTVLCYLNADWKMEDGGALEIYPPVETTTSSTTGQPEKANSGEAQSTQEASGSDDDDAPSLPTATNGVDVPVAGDSSAQAEEKSTAHSEAHSGSGSNCVTSYPLAGRLAMFWSESVPHAVLPTFAPRYALTVWYYDSEERQKSILEAKSKQQIAKGRKGATAANRKAVRHSDILKITC